MTSSAMLTVKHSYIWTLLWGPNVLVPRFEFISIHSDDYVALLIRRRRSCHVQTTDYIVSFLR